MITMVGYYETDNPPTQYLFEVSSKESAIHNTYYIRYRFGKKKEKENLWEYEE